MVQRQLGLTQSIAKDVPALPESFLCRPAEVVGSELVGCRLVKLQPDGSLLWGVVVETDAYSQDAPACHGYERRTTQNETLFGPPGRFFVYVSYGIQANSCRSNEFMAHHACVVLLATLSLIFGGPQTR